MSVHVTTRRRNMTELMQNALCDNQQDETYLLCYGLLSVGHWLAGFLPPLDLSDWQLQSHGWQHRCTERWPRCCRQAECQLQPAGAAAASSDAEG